MYDNPNMTAKQIVEESERIMKGQRGKYFGLELSFFGWILTYYAYIWYWYNIPNALYSNFNCNLL